MHLAEAGSGPLVVLCRPTSGAPWSFRAAGTGRSKSGRAKWPKA